MAMRNAWTFVLILAAVQTVIYSIIISAIQCYTAPPTFQIFAFSYNDLMPRAAVFVTSSEFFL